MCVLNFQFCVFQIVFAQGDVSIQRASYASVAGSHSVHLYVLQ